MFPVFSHKILWDPGGLFFFSAQLYLGFSILLVSQNECILSMAHIKT